MKLTSPAFSHSVELMPDLLVLKIAVALHMPGELRWLFWNVRNSVNYGSDAG